MILDDEPITRLLGLAAGIEEANRRLAERLLAPLDLSYAQLGVLSAVAEGDGHTQRELAERIGSDAKAVVSVCNALVHKGLVARRADPEQRGVLRVSLTARGRRAYERALRVVSDLYAPMVSTFSVSEVESAMPVLRRMRAYLEQRERGG